VSQQKRGYNDRKQDSAYYDPPDPLTAPCGGFLVAFVGCGLLLEHSIHSALLIGYKLSNQFEDKARSTSA
jgi:hypothetical protein